MAFGAKFVGKIKRDPNCSRVGKGFVRLRRNIGPGSIRYLAARVPIVQWLPNYSPRWLISDLIAGQSAALLLIPQALMFAQIAGIPLKDGLLAAWLPGLIYTIMGTSKDISIGPSLSIALSLAQTIKGIQKESPQTPPILVATVTSLAVGIWTLILGLLNLGFIFDFVSLPLSLAFVSSLGLVLINSQVPAFLGLNNITPVYAKQLPAIIKAIHEIQPISIGLAAVSLLVLVFLNFLGKRYGKTNEALRIFCNSKNILVISAMTLVSFLVNKDLDIPLWSIAGEMQATIPAPVMPLSSLFKSLFQPSGIAAFTIAMEHILLARVMGHQNGYKISQSQELVTLGTTNIINAMIGGMPVGGGDLTRSSILSESGAKSPLAGLFTAGTVLGGMYAASPFLLWIPTPTLGAVIALAAYETMPPMKNMAVYYRLSFLEFIVFLATFNFTLMASSLIGIMGGAFISLFGTLGRAMFRRAYPVSRTDIEHKYLLEPDNAWKTSDRIVIPPGMQVLAVNSEIMFLNTPRIKRYILDTVYTNHIGKPMPIGIGKDPNRPWNFIREKYIANLKHKANRSDVETYSPRIRTVVFDFSCVPFIDSAGIHIFQEVKKEIRDFGGEDVGFRFVGLNESVRARFQRAKWELEDFKDLNQERSIPNAASAEVQTGNTVSVSGNVVVREEEISRESTREEEATGPTEEEKVVKDLVFELLPTAVMYHDGKRRGSEGETMALEGLLMGERKQKK